MSCFIYKSLTIQINIFSTEAELIEKRLRYECRGLWGTIPDSKYTSSIKINTIDSLKNGFHSSDLIYVLDKHCLNSQFNYFILNIGDDISNLNLGIKIREWSIEKAIKAKSHVDKIELPIITYYCEDPDISHLAESMVVQLEAHGDSWYNNYSLIPFGMLTNRYSYDNLSGGYFERVSQSTHLQYCGVAPRDSESRQEALEEYYSRFYNRDSSMAVARSLPYRLFQTSTCSGLDHIIPVGWNITNANAFTNAVSIDDMANDFNSRNNTDELILYEHARWARWMISRGWSSASPDETIQYMDAGNLKQQLYIGRLHPCICDFSELDHLSNIMYDHYLEKGDTRFVDTPFKKKDFTKFDKSNIEQTADIIKTIWFTRQNDMDREL